MAEKQIGIKLDVKSTGLKQVDEALDSVSKNLKDMNSKVLERQQKGWGSESQTKELREQLRYMQQMLQTTERMARTKGVHSETFSNLNREISSMNRDVSNVPTYRSNIGGWIQDKFGERNARAIEKLSGTIGNLSSLSQGLGILSTLRSGLSTGDQLAFGMGDLAKRMNPGVNSLNYGINMINGLQGYGYSNTDIMNSATSYGAVTGRINPNTFQSQMQSIEQTGRRYGWDLGQTTQYFSNAYQSGVTGGSNGQMSAQEFASLVANVTVQAHMQGKESEMVNQLSQLTRMTISNTGQAGDQKTLAAFLSIGDKTGNQALIHNLPNMVQNIDEGIKNPGGGYFGQALMMRAIGGGKMSFWKEQYLQSQGAFGQDTDANGKPIGPTNIEKVTDYALKMFKGDKYRTAVMVGQTLNLPPAQAMQYIDTYTKDGKAVALNNLKGQTNAPTANVPQNATDAMRNKNQALQNAADNAGMKTTGIRSDLKSLGGNILDYLGPEAVLGGMAAGGATTLYTGYRILKGMTGMFKGPGAGAAAETAASNVVPFPNAAGAGAGTSSILKTVLGRAGTVAGVLEAPDMAKSIFDFIFGHTKGDRRPVGPFENPFKEYRYTDSSPSLRERLFGNDGKPAASSSTSMRDVKEVGPTTAVGTTQTAPTPMVGAQLAPIVASTIVALGPFMGQLKGVFGGDGSKQVSGGLSDLVDRSGGKFSMGAGLATGNPLDGLIKLANLVNSTDSIKPTNLVKPGDNLFNGDPGGGGSFSGTNVNLAGYRVDSNSGVTADRINKLVKGTDLAGHGQDFINAGNKYGIDPSYLVALTKAEQGFRNPYGSNNFVGLTKDLGFGDGRKFKANDGQALVGFASIQDGLMAAAKNLRSYANKGITSVEDVSKRWVGKSGWVNERSTINGVLGQLLSLKGEVTVNIKQPGGPTTKVKAPLKAAYHGI